MAVLAHAGRVPHFLLLLGGLVFLKDLIDQAVRERFGRVHVAVALGVAFDVLVLPSGFAGENVDQGLFDLENLIRLDAHVRGLSADIAPGLVDHHLGMWQAKRLPLVPAARITAAPLLALPMQ